MRIVTSLLLALVAVLVWLSFVEMAFPALAQGGAAPDPKWAIANAAAGATSAHHRPSAAAPPQTLHQVVCGAVSPSVSSGRRAVFPGAFPRRVLNQPAATSRSISRSRYSPLVSICWLAADAEVNPYLYAS